MTTRVKSAEEMALETEFQRRRNMVSCNVLYEQGGKRSTSVTLTVLGVEIGTRTEFTTRGKVSSVLITLPSLDRLNALLSLPVAGTEA
jgi:hypothetical protein